MSWIETDGNGRLIEIVESRSATLYGCSRAEIRWMRSPSFRGPARREYSRYRGRKKRTSEMLGTVTAFLEEHPKATVRQVNTELGISHTSAGYHLRCGVELGLFEVTTPKGQPVSKGSWPYLYSLRNGRRAA
jgi:hypothetical protein